MEMGCMRQLRYEEAPAAADADAAIVKLLTARTCAHLTTPSARCCSRRRTNRCNCLAAYLKGWVLGTNEHNFSCAAEKHARSSGAGDFNLLLPQRFGLLKVSHISSVGVDVAWPVNAGRGIWWDVLIDEQCGRKGWGRGGCTFWQLQRGMVLLLLLLLMMMMARRGRVNARCVIIAGMSGRMQVTSRCRDRKARAQRWMIFWTGF
jgi:hypothetical protein